MGLDWRKHSPVQLAIGPVLDADDAVANKVCALFGRAEVRDYIDVDAVLASGGTPNLICSHSPPATTQASTHCGSLRRSALSAACLICYSSRMA
jgi:hypothetical protein